VVECRECRQFHPATYLAQIARLASQLSAADVFLSVSFELRDVARLCALILRFQLASLWISLFRILSNGIQDEFARHSLGRFCLDEERVFRKG
jgi:hypothetical protein